MIKKIFFLLLFVFTFQFFPCFSVNSPIVYAQDGSIDSASFMFDLSSITHDGIDGSTRQGWIRRGLNYFFEKIIGFMATIIGSLSVLVLSFGGFLMLSSAGNESMYERGKNYVIYALVGLAVTLSSYIMVVLVQLLIKSIYA